MLSAIVRLALGTVLAGAALSGMPRPAAASGVVTCVPVNASPTAPPSHLLLIADPLHRRVTRVVGPIPGPCPPMHQDPGWTPPAEAPGG